MPKLPQISGWKIVKLLQKEGWILVSQKGSHVKLSRIIDSQKQTVIIPLQKILKKGTLRNGILKSINLSIEDFAKLIKD